MWGFAIFPRSVFLSNEYLFILGRFSQAIVSDGHVVLISLNESVT